MAVYAIGDVQGCLASLKKLLDHLCFDDRHDRLWFVGDLVNRGPQSLATLRFIKNLGDVASVVLGNHDLHMLAVAQGLRPPTPQDTLTEILQAPDRVELFDWVRTRPLLHHDADLGYTMVHAGLSPQWDLAQASQCAREVEDILSAEQYQDFIAHMYGDEPDFWSAEVGGIERWRYIVNCFTRLRYCDRQGRLVLSAKGKPGQQHAGLTPWFNVAGRKSAALNIVFGHWSTLGCYHEPGVYALDSGCVWGGSLTALRLTGQAQWFSVACEASCEID